MQMESMLPLQALLKGLKLALNVGAMLLAFIALLALINSMLKFTGALPNSLGEMVGLDIPVLEVTIQTILGYLFMPRCVHYRHTLAGCTGGWFNDWNQACINGIYCLC